MRKAISIAGAVLLGASTLAAPANASHVGVATGSCGFQEGAFGMDNLDADMPGHQGNTVPAAFYEIRYSGVQAPTTIGVIIRYNDDLDTVFASAAPAPNFVANASSGTFVGAIRSSVDPSAQGGGDTRERGETGNIRSNKGRSERVSATGAGRSSSVGTASGQYRGSAGGIGPGLYAFYVYTGEVRDMPATMKDGPAGRRFIADESGFLGKFECGIEDDK